MRKNLLLFSIMFLLFGFMAVPSVFADTLAVCPSGCNYTTIIHAVGNASSGDVVDVSAGTYTGDFVIGTSLTLQGEGSGTTIINGDNTLNQVVQINASNVTITGFRIDGLGANAELIAFANDTFNNTVISYNHLTNCTPDSAIDFYIDPAFPVGYGANITNNLIEYFGSSSGDGGIYVHRLLDVFISQNTITNSNDYKITGIYMFDYSGGIIDNNVISWTYGAIMVNSNVEEVYITNNALTDTCMGILLTETFAKVHMLDNYIETSSAGYCFTNRAIVLGGDGDFYDSCPPYPYEVDNLSHAVTGNTIVNKGSLNPVAIRVLAGMIDEDYGASGVVTHNTIRNFKYAFKVQGKGAGASDRTNHTNVVFNLNNVINCTEDGIVTDWTGDAGSIDAENNWWDNVSGAYLISDKYDAVPFLTGMITDGESEEASGGDTVTNDDAGIGVDLAGATGSGTVMTADYTEVPYTETTFAVAVGDTPIRYVDVYASGFSGNIEVVVNYEEGDIPYGIDEVMFELYMWYDNDWHLGSGRGRDTDANQVWATFPANKFTGSPIVIGGTGQPVGQAFPLFYILPILMVILVIANMIRLAVTGEVTFNALLKMFLLVIFTVVLTACLVGLLG